MSSASSKSEEPFRQMIDMMPALAWSSRPDGAAEFINEAWLEYTGLRAAEALEAGWTMAVHPDDVNTVVAYWQSALAAGEPREIEGRLRRFDGEYRWFLFRAKPLRDGTGRVTKWFGTNTDIDDRKRAELALADGERQLRLIVDTIPAFVCTMNAQGELETANRQLIDYMGMGSRELKEWKSIGTVHKEDLPGVIAKWRHSIESGEPYDIEHRIRRADGVFRWFHVRGLPLRDDNNRVSHWYVLLTDIEDRKRAEEARIKAEHDTRKSEWHLRQFIETLPAVAWRSRADGVLDFANQRLADYTGKPLQQIHADGGWMDTVHPEDLHANFAAWTRAHEAGLSYDATFRVRRSDGEYRWNRVIVEPSRDPEGAVRNWYGLMLDVDDRKRAVDALRESERALSASEARLRMIIDAIPALVWRASADGRMEYVNKRVTDYTGESFEDAVHSGLVTIHPEDRDLVVAAWMRAIETSERFSVTYRLRGADGVHRWFEAEAVPLRDADGRVLNWFGLASNVDENRRTLLELRESRDKLSRASRVATVAELSASIAHEINQPLAAIVANGEAAQAWLAHRPADIERADASLERIVRDGHAAADVVRRIRALFKHAPPTKEASDVNAIVLETLRLVAEEIRQHGIVVDRTLAHDLPAVPADRMQLQHAVLNLVHNAIEAMQNVEGRPRTLSLTSAATGSDVLVTVADRGSGIADPTLMFEPFFTTKVNGLGMGLAICRSIIEGHGGRLWATPNEGPGTTFAFTVPLDDPG
jgi:PAS domain S-box-containing protein